MEANVRSNNDEESLKESLLKPNGAKEPKPKSHKAIRKTFKGTAQLSKLLPTGCVSIFQSLSPILTQEGKCQTIASQYLTLALVFLCGLSCFALCFTDSLRDERGKVRYGIVTRRGIRMIDGCSNLTPEESERYKLRFLDFVHAFTTVLVFSAVALFNQNVVQCFFPLPSEEVKELLERIPVAIVIVCGLFILLFPTRRHGIGSPLSKE